MTRNFNQDKDAQSQFWDKVAKQRVYAAFDQNEYEEIIDRTLGKDLSGKTIVDLGSASGVSAALFAARGASVIGIDISPSLVEQAKELWKEYQDQINFAVGDAERLELEDDSVDAIFFGGVLHHIPHLENVYSEAMRILKPGGSFIAIEPNRLDFFERIEWGVADLRGKLAPEEYPVNPVEMRKELMNFSFENVRYWITRQDIPVLNQFPILKHVFSRERGFWLKRPLLRFINAFRAPEARGTFVVVSAQKPINSYVGKGVA